MVSLDNEQNGIIIVAQLAILTNIGHVSIMFVALPAERKYIGRSSILFMCYLGELGLFII